MLVDFPKRIVRSLMNGNAARLPGLGTFKLRVQGKARENIDDVTAAGCTVQVVFDVDPALASQLKDAKFQFVAKPTAEGEQDAADESGNGGAGQAPLNITSGSAPEVPVQAVGPPTIGKHQQWCFSFC